MWCCPFCSVLTVWMSPVSYWHTYNPIVCVIVAHFIRTCTDPMTWTYYSCEIKSHIDTDSWIKRHTPKKRLKKCGITTHVGVTVVQTLQRYPLLYTSTSRHHTCLNATRNVIDTIRGASLRVPLWLRRGGFTPDLSSRSPVVTKDDGHERTQIYQDYQRAHWKQNVFKQRETQHCICNQ